MKKLLLVFSIGMFISGLFFNFAIACQCFNFPASNCELVKLPSGKCYVCQEGYDENVNCLGAQ